MIAVTLLSLSLAALYLIIFLSQKNPSFLVVAINLLWLVCPLTLVASIWSYNFQYSLGIVYAMLAFVGDCLIILSPFCNSSTIIMNDYIPILENIIFILGLTLFSTGMLLFAVNITITYFCRLWGRYQKTPMILNIFTLSSAIMFILVWICFGCSYFQIYKIIQLIPIEIEFYYEMLFWSGRHLFQFFYIQILIIISIILFEILTGTNLKFKGFYVFILCLNFIFSIYTVTGHLMYDIIDEEFKQHYTNYTKYCIGIAPTLNFLAMFLQLIFKK